MNKDNFNFNYQGELHDINPLAWKTFIRESLYTLDNRYSPVAPLALARDLRAPIWMIARLAQGQSEHITSRQDRAVQKTYSNFKESLPPVYKREIRSRLSSSLSVNYESEAYQAEFDVADLIDQILLDVFAEGVKTRYLEPDELKHRVGKALLPVFKKHQIHFTTTRTSPGYMLMQEILEFIGIKGVNTRDLAYSKC